jgi:hypothetical protein
MKLVDEHGEGQGNPKDEVALDSQRAQVIVWPCQLLPPLHSRFFFYGCYDLTRLVGKNGYP